jgi:hypothetical protein
MDSPTRNFLGLVGSSAALAAYPVCGFIAYVLIPLLGLSPGALAHLGPACLLPAVALTVLVGTSAGLAARTLGRQMSASRRLSRRVRALALPPPPELSVAAKASGLDGRVTMVDSAEQFSFVYGILVPRVAIGRGFLESLTAEELRAALEHERYHVRHLDPLRALLGKALTEAFFLLPSLEVLRLRYEAGREAGGRPARRARRRPKGASRSPAEGARGAGSRVGGKRLPGGPRAAGCAYLSPRNREGTCAGVGRHPEPAFLGARRLLLSLVVHRGGGRPRGHFRTRQHGG